jgi:hypothetical protein
MDCGLTILVKPVSMVMDKGYPSNNVWTNTVEIEYEGEVSNFNDSLYSYGVDERSGVGSLVYLTIEFVEDPEHDIPSNSNYSSIGWLEVYPMTYLIPGEDRPNPILFKIRLSLKKSDFQDFMLFGNNVIQIQPIFNWDKDVKFVTYTSNDLVQFYISRIEVKPHISGE